LDLALIYIFFSARSSDAVDDQCVSKGYFLVRFWLPYHFSEAVSASIVQRHWLAVVNGATAMALTRHHKQHLEPTSIAPDGQPVTTSATSNASSRLSPKR
jgi:hypothetical protein